jgi:hypothetical protein
MNNMMLVQDMYQNVPSFKMIPVNNDCPFLEAAFNPQSRELIVRHRDKIPVFQLFDKLDDTGRPVPVTGKKTADGVQAFKLQRIQYEGNVTYTLGNVEDVVRFMKRFLIEEDQPAVDVMFPVMTQEQIDEMKAQQKEEELKKTTFDDLQPAEQAAITDVTEE